MLLLLACSSVTTLSELSPRRLSLALENDGLTSTPPMYGVYAVLEWDLSGALGSCAGLDGLTLRFAEAEDVAYDLGGARGTACDHDAAVSHSFEAAPWLDSESEAVELFDDSATVSATVSYPVAMRALEPAESVATPGATTRFEWWPPRDLLPDSLDVRVEVIGGESSTETVSVVDGGFDVAVPYTAAGGALRVTAEIAEVSLEVTDLRGLESAAVTAVLSHLAEGAVSVGPID